MGGGVKGGYGGWGEGGYGGVKGVYGGWGEGGLWGWGDTGWQLLFSSFMVYIPVSPFLLSWFTFPFLHCFISFCG